MSKGVIGMLVAMCTFSMFWLAGSPVAPMLEWPFWRFIDNGILLPFTPVKMVLLALFVTSFLAWAVGYLVSGNQHEAASRRLI